MRQYTREHATIRSWAEARGGQPARVKGSQVLRLAFERLPPNWESLPWDEFFETFDRGGLVFMFEDTPGSRICKLTKGAGTGPIGQVP
jgi:hypothetical protein